MLLTFSVSVIVAFPFFVLISAWNNTSARKLMWGIIHYWAMGWLWISGMPLTRIGDIPSDGRFIIALNHISYLDAIIIFPALQHYFRPLGKIEMARIPLMGFIYRQIALLVDRRSADSRARSMRLMYRTLRSGSDIVIFPEGTFNETGAPLKKFYDGAFRLAIHAQTPILPVVLLDTERRWHYSGWWKTSPGRNRVVYLQPIPVAGLTMADLPALKEQVYRAMEAALIEWKA